MLLVTGITGHSGRFFLYELMKHNYVGSLRCIVRETSDTSELDNSGLSIEKFYGDLNDKDFVCKAMCGIDTIMHIYNIHHSPIIVAAAIENHVKRVILVHTTGIYSEFKYASQEYKDVEKKVKEMTESPYCQTRITILRPTMIYGDLCDSNMSKFIKLIDKLRVMPLIDGGRSLIQPVNARDLGKAYYLVLTTAEKTDGKTYDLSGAKPLQMREVLELIGKCLNKRTIFVSFPIGVGVFLAKVVKRITFSKVDYIEKVQRMGEDRSYAHDNATNDFDFRPMSFEEGIKIEVNQYLNKVSE